MWNRANAGHLATRGLTPLAPEAVLAQRELAEQPLLLLMLALYDADGNGLQRAGTGLRRSDLYERLLHSFARREVAKLRPGLPPAELDRAIEDELRRLSIVAFAMFNRASQWVSDTDLDADLSALPLAGPPPPAAAGLRTPLRAADLVLGRFFFIHRAQASRDDSRLATYEFLHATFGEYLVARLTWQAVRDIAARQDAAVLSPAADDDLLHALVSFTVLSVRSAILGFLTDRAAELSTADQAALTELLIRLFEAADRGPRARGYAGYEPRRLPVPQRHAAYAANLVLLAACVAPDGVFASRLFAGQPYDPVTSWHRYALLWRSQLDIDEWSSVVAALDLNRRWGDGGRDIRIYLYRGGYLATPVDLRWTFDLPRDIAAGEWVRGIEDLERKAYFGCGVLDDLSLHALEPLMALLRSPVVTDARVLDDTVQTPANALLHAWVLSVLAASPDLRTVAYWRCLQLADLDKHYMFNEYGNLLVGLLAADEAVSTATGAAILTKLIDWPEVDRRRIIRCALTMIGRGTGDDDARLADVLRLALIEHRGITDLLTLEAAVWLAERDEYRPDRAERRAEPRGLEDMLRLAARRPGLVERLARVADRLGLSP